jgi:hypothetical protein
MMMPCVIAFKDILSTLVGAMFVMTEDETRRAKVIFEEKQSQLKQL